MSIEEINAPEKLTPKHDLTSFSSGAPDLDIWLRRRALSNQESGASRTYVICAGSRVIGYYALVAGAIVPALATGRTRRNMPNPLPVMVIGRLAIAIDFQGRGFGRALLRDAILRTVQAAEIAGIRAILVHAISEEAKKFYERCGFQSSPIDPMTLMITVRDAHQALTND